MCLNNNKLLTYKENRIFNKYINICNINEKFYIIYGK